MRKMNCNTSFINSNYGHNKKVRGNCVIAETKERIHILLQKKYHAHEKNRYHVHMERNT